jgi:hypothetical protein
VLELLELEQEPVVGLGLELVVGLVQGLVLELETLKHSFELLLNP